MELAACSGRNALALGNRYTGDPDDFFAVRDHRQAVTEMSRNMAVDQDVLQALRLTQPERAHAVTRPAGGDGQRQLDEIGIPAADLVAGLEGRWIANAGAERHGRR